jgi:3-methylornithine--L-lysine ligase
MIAAIVGGRLQGVELGCLARKAGWRTLLVDRDGQVPAKGLCDRFIQRDIREPSALDDALGSVDLVIPALEDRQALETLVRWAHERRVPVAFDSRAYAVTSSKIESNRLFAFLGIPAPRPWPRCGFPMVVKPDEASGSEGVTVLGNELEAKARFPHGFPKSGWVLQEYLEGPSFSLEVIGRPGNYVPLQVTELFMDGGYDCKRVAAPSGLTDAQVREMERMAVDIAEAVRLFGLMDMEVILHEGHFKVLEIDARFPSQTPLAVHGSTGCNMMELLADLFIGDQPVSWRPAGPARGLLLEHIRVEDGTLHIEGEHILVDAGPLARLPGFFGADEALTNFREGASRWVGTLIVSGVSRRHAEEMRQRVLNAIRHRFHLSTLADPSPEDLP